MNRRSVNQISQLAIIYFAVVALTNCRPVYFINNSVYFSHQMDKCGRE